MLQPFDLHVLSLPPAFVLSQDQTLKFNVLFEKSVPPTPLARSGSFEIPSLDYLPGLAAGLRTSDDENIPTNPKVSPDVRRRRRIPFLTDDA